MIGPCNTLLPGAASVRSGPGPRLGESDIGRTKPGQKGASHALNLLCLGQRLIDPVFSLRLPGKNAHRGPPPGGGYPCRGLTSMSLCLRCATSRPRHSPWEDLSARLSDKAMREGREIDRDRVRGIGLPRVEFRPPRLRLLDSSEGGG